MHAQPLLGPLIGLLAFGFVVSSGCIVDTVEADDDAGARDAGATDVRPVDVLVNDASQDDATADDAEVNDTSEADAGFDAGSVDSGGDAGTPADPTRPNIVIILADDMGYGDLEPYNPDSKIPTPHINQLAAQGLRFTDAHSPAAVCTPTRYGILTGRYAWRTRLKEFVLRPYDAPLIAPGRLTMPRFLSRLGYRTAMIGKWHLGMAWPTSPAHNFSEYKLRAESSVDFGGRIAAGPLTAGFDSYFGVDVPNYPPYIFVEDDHVFGEAPSVQKPGSMFGLAGLMQPGWTLEGILPGLRDRAVAVIADHAASRSDQPLFLYMALTAPHTPIVPNAGFVGTSQAGVYGDFVAEVDALVGSVASALEINGMAPNTLFVVTSDNGSPGRDGHHAAFGTVMSAYGHSVNGPLRGYKADIWEAGHRVPLIARWPDHIPAGTRSDVTVGLIDLLATIADITKTPLPDDAAEDSYSFWPALINPAITTTGRPELVLHSLHGVFALRSADWKLIMGDGSGGFTQPVGSSLPNGPGQLYDLGVDLGETHNLYSGETATVDALLPILDAIKSQLRSVPARDTDADGVSDWGELRAGTDPSSNASVPTITTVVLDVTDDQVVGVNGSVDDASSPGGWGASTYYVRERKPSDVSQELRSRLFVRFESSLVPAGVVVSAHLRLHQNNRLDTESNTTFAAQVAVGRVTEAWSSSAGSYPLFDGTGVVGEVIVGSNEDFGTAVDASGFYSGMVGLPGTEAGVDITSLVLPWFDGMATDHGLRIRLDDRNSRGASFSDADIAPTPENETLQLIVEVAEH